MKAFEIIMLAYLVTCLAALLFALGAGLYFAFGN